MSNFSSFDKDKKIFDGWRQFLNESAAPGMAVLDEEELEERREAEEEEAAPPKAPEKGREKPSKKMLDKEVEKIKDRHEKWEDEQTQTNEQKELEEQEETPGAKKKELRIHPPKSGKLTDKFTVGPDTVEDAMAKAKKEKAEKKNESVDYDAIIQEVYRRLTKG